MQHGVPERGILFRAGIYRTIDAGDDLEIARRNEGRRTRKVETG